MMDFSDALRALKDGHGVYRRLWQSRTAQGRAGFNMTMRIVRLPDAGSHAVMPQIMTVSPEDGVLRPFAGAQWDLLADDWEIAP